MFVKLCVSGIVKSPLAGDFMAIESRKLMEDLGIEVVPPYVIHSKVCHHIYFITLLMVVCVTVMHSTGGCMYGLSQTALTFYLLYWSYEVHLACRHLPPIGIMHVCQ